MARRRRGCSSKIATAAPETGAPTSVPDRVDSGCPPDLYPIAVAQTGQSDGAANRVAAGDWRVQTANSPVTGSSIHPAPFAAAGGEPIAFVAAAVQAVLVSTAALSRLDNQSLVAKQGWKVRAAAAAGRCVAHSLLATALPSPRRFCLQGVFSATDRLHPDPFLFVVTVDLLQSINNRRELQLWEFPNQTTFLERWLKTGAFQRTPSQSHKEIRLAGAIDPKNWATREFRS